MRNIGQLLAIAHRTADSGERDADRTTLLISPIMAMPSGQQGDGAGGAAIRTGYEIGLRGVPDRLVTLAVERALSDASRRFRPGPNELRAYVSDELATTRRRLHRLEELRRDPAGLAPRGMAEVEGQDRGAMKQQVDDLMQRLAAKMANGGAA